MKTIRNVVFDLDGTLVDSALDILATLRLAVAEAGIRRNVPMTTALIGPPVGQMLRNWQQDLSDAEVEQANTAFRRLYDNNSTLPNTLPYPGISQCMLELRSADCSLYVATNKPHAATRGILQRHFPTVIDGFCCADSLPERKLYKTQMLCELTTRYALEANESVIVGDSESDMRAGKDLGWRTMAALYGYGNADALKGTQPTWLAESPSTIAAILTSV